MTRRRGLPSDQLASCVPRSLAQPELASVVVDWLKGLATCTRRAYEGDLIDFARSLKMNSPLDAIRLLVQSGAGAANMIALKYRNQLADRKLAPATIARRLAALRSAVALVRVAGLVEWRLEVRSPKVVPYKDVRGPGVHGARALLEACGETGEKALRNRVLVRLLYDLALRRDEVVSLDLEHVDLAGRRLWIKGKARGGEREPVTLPGPTLDVLRTHLAARGNPTGGPLFVNFDRARKGVGRLTGDGLRKIIQQLGKRAGIGRVRPHGLRHAAIIGARRAGVDVRLVSVFARHKDIRTTMRYDDDLRDDAGGVSAIVAGLLDREDSVLQQAPRDSSDQASTSTD